MGQPLSSHYALTRDGSSDPEAVLWIHGYTMSGEVWHEHWRAMPERRHVAVDLPAHGRAPALGQRQTLSGWVDGLRELAEAEQIRHIVAVSFGGLVALALAARMGTSLRTMVLNSPAVPGSDFDPAAQACSLAIIRQFGRQGRGPWLTETWLEWPHAIFSGMRAHTARWHALRAVIESHEWRELEDGSINRMALGERCETLTRSVRAASLLVSGEQDIEVFKRNVEVLRRGIVGARRIRAAGCGHLAFLEEPGMAAELITRHIGQG